MKISELRPFAKKVELTVKALSKNEIREVTSKLDNSTHKVTEVMVGDDSGTVLLTLWDDAIEKVEPGKAYKIANAFTSLFKNTLRLNLGRYGELSESEDDIQVNETNNMSEKELEVRRRPFNRGFGGGRGGGMHDNYNRSEGSESGGSEESG
jgi:replication factor A1